MAGNVLPARNPGECEIHLRPASINRGFEIKDRIAVVQLLAYFAAYSREIISAVGPDFHIVYFMRDTPQERFFHREKLGDVV